jgi:hypothetical protein
MSAATGAKEFLEFKQTIKDLEKQVELLVRETAENGASKKARLLTGEVYVLAERANRIQLRENRDPSTTNQTTLGPLSKQFDQEYGRFNGLTSFVRRVRKQHYDATGHNIGRTYGGFGSSEIAPGHRHGKFQISTLEIRCDACGSESPQSDRRDYPIHILLHDRGQWEVCTGQSDCECQNYTGKGVRIGVSLSRDGIGKGRI